MTTKKITLFADTFTVTLDKLSRDPGNVRRTEIGAEIETLADDIAAHGLLHNLGVRPDERAGRFLVCIGGRRLAALHHLVSTKRLAKNAPIPCRAIDPDEATSAGLAENLSRIAMHPADAYLAFAALIEQGRSAADVAQRFGVSERTVERRMRLGRLSPVVLDAFREGKIGEDDARAFALTTDHAAQERVYADLETRTMHLNAWTIKRMLTADDVPAGDARARFVGLDAYEAAGGGVRRDLFAEHAYGATLTDPKLLNRLTLAGLEDRIASRVRAEGWARVTVQLETPDRAELIGWTKARPAAEAVPAGEDAERFAAIIAREGELEAQEELSEQDDEELTRLQLERDAIEERGIRYDPADTARGRAVVCLATFGEPTVFRMVPIADEGTEAETVQDEEEDNGDPRPEQGEPDDGKGALSGALTATLRGQRTMALQAQVAERPGLALRLLAQALLMRRDHSGRDAPLKLRLETPDTLAMLANELADCPARKALDEAHAAREDHQPGDHRDLLPWLLRMDDAAVVDLLGPLLAEAVDAGTADWTVKGDGFAAQAARAAQYDPAPWWTATAESYFGRVSKAQIAEAVLETGEHVDVSGKKAALAAEATRKVAGTGWTPTLLRAPSPANDDGIRFAAE